MLQSNQVQCTPQDYINELIIRILNLLAISRNTANGFTIQKINSLLHS